MIKLTDENLKEIFALFCSCTNYEIQQIYSSNDKNHFLNERLDDEYLVHLEKRDIAFDSWNAVLYFLNKNGYSLVKGNETIKLDFINSEYP